jgi:hypothetical protein
MVKRVATVLAVVALLAVGTAAYAGRSEQKQPEAQVPRNLPESNDLAGEEIRIWGVTNDEAVADLTQKRIEYEALAAGAAVTDPAEAASYQRAADGIQQYIDAVCALPDTTVC